MPSDRAVRPRHRRFQNSFVIDFLRGGSNDENAIFVGVVGADLPVGVGITWPGRHVVRGRPLTGLHYYDARWYDPRIGKFVSEDPIGLEAGDANLMRISSGSARSWPRVARRWPRR